MKIHIDAPLHVRGESEYVDDLPPPAGMLHAQVFGSPVAHGRVKALDVEAARRAEGVVAVLTAKEIPGKNILGPIVLDEWLLAEDLVEYVGQPMAVVVAETWELARKALRLVRTEIDPLPPVVNPREAFAKGEVIHEGRTFALGDVDAAWSMCDLVLEGDVDLAGQEHLYLETNRARAMPREDRTMQVFAGTQSPYATQKSIARILGVAEHKVEVDVLRLGGGFGGKEDQGTHWACMAALAAQHTRRPVELVLSRMDDIRMTGKRHPYLSDFKIGLQKDGTILAFEARHYQNAGAYADLSPPVLERTLFHSTNSYYIPNARIFAVPCKTNLAPNTAFRGFGGPQGMVVIEAAISKAAEALGLSREAVQRKNLLKDGDEFPYGQKAFECQARSTWDRLVEQEDLVGWRNEIDAFNSRHPMHKRGLAIMPVCFGISFTKTFLNQASALVLIYADGSVSVANGGVEMGQGNNSKLCNIVAETLGIHDERVRCESTNTRRIANMAPSAASATTDLNGQASILACEKILVGLKALAAKQLGASPDEVAIVDETVTVRGEKSDWDWPKLTAEAWLNRVPLMAHGFFATPEIYFDRETEKGHPFAYHTYGAAAIEVELDALRGSYAIRKIRVVHDVGRPINPVVDLGQVEGGLAQGLGWISLEELKFNEQGFFTSNSLSTYKVPDVYFMPDDMRVTFLDAVENRRGPLGSKAVGEPPLMYGIGLFFAVRDAMRAFRPDLAFNFAMPLTPERVLTQLYPEALAEVQPSLQAPTPVGASTP